MNGKWTRKPQFPGERAAQIVRGAMSAARYI